MFETREDYEETIPWKASWKRRAIRFDGESALFLSGTAVRPPFWPADLAGIFDLSEETIVRRWFSRGQRRG